MKILIIKRDKIGDLLLTTPMLQHLREKMPGAEIHVLANDYNAWVVSDNPNIDRLWVYPRTKTGKKISVVAVIKQVWQEAQLRRERFDVVIVAGGEESPRAIRRALRLRALRTIAYCASAECKESLTDSIAPQNSMHEVDRMLGLLAPLGIVAPAREIHPQYILPDTWLRFASAWLAEKKLIPGGYIVIGLGARRAKKQPSTEQVLRWASRFKQEYNLDTVFMWTPGKSDNPLYPGDDEVAQPVLDAGVPYIHPFRGALMPALGLIWQARTSIFPDSGLMHFAAASPGGVLGLFAETDISPSPLQWGPRGPKAVHLEATKSVTQLSDEQVYEKLHARLGEGRAFIDIGRG